MNDGAPEATGTCLTASAMLAEKDGAAVLAAIVVSFPSALKENPSISTSVKSLASLCDTTPKEKVRSVLANTKMSIRFLNIVLSFSAN
jgi:hypothetical protein